MVRLDPRSAGIVRGESRMSRRRAHDVSRSTGWNLFRADLVCFFFETKADMMRLKAIAIPKVEVKNAGMRRFAARLPST